MAKTVDSYKFTGGITKRVLQTWAKMESPRQIPWTPLKKPLDQCRVALISSGGIALKDDPPFNQEVERLNPWWGDPTYRTIPRGTKSEQIKLYHLHVDPCCVEADINCLLPINRLDELVEAGEIGDAALTHYSFMGYTTQPDFLVEESTPVIVENLQTEVVDVVVLVPA